MTVLGLVADANLSLGVRSAYIYVIELCDIPRSELCRRPSWVVHVASATARPGARGKPSPHATVLDVPQARVLNKCIIIRAGQAVLPRGEPPFWALPVDLSIRRVFPEGHPSARKASHGARRRKDPDRKDPKCRRTVFGLAARAACTVTEATTR